MARATPVWLLGLTLPVAALAQPAALQPAASQPALPPVAAWAKSGSANPAAMRDGTSPDRCIANPRSVMSQRINASDSGKVVANGWPIEKPSGSAVTRAAAAPSPNCSIASSGSISGVS